MGEPTLTAAEASCMAVDGRAAVDSNGKDEVAGLNLGQLPGLASRAGRAAANGAGRCATAVNISASTKARQ